ncbi:methyl-accepting chemotaxis protein [Tumebacillus permanentifrigoris]|uniref:Methyl-accepting chemotaxis protein n=1 Tax=Tumebacillus permanentifrigoris TaxID=378543 RepID=A0A316D6R7_9BACL|nr:methyl-accepting chemotaxis protein [Tumebacillus permanentifrigoris]PWK07468.1 methyl-accepting chemotaxis protein [Tumebacillus permanentifrigoris]
MKMKKMRYSLRVRMVIWNGIVVFLLLLIGWRCYQHFISLEQLEGTVVEQVQPKNKAADALVTDLVSMQNSVRGYLLNGQESSLSSYQATQAKLQKDIETVRSGELNHDVIKDLVEKDVLPKVKDLQVQLDTQIQLGKSGKLAEARAAVAKVDADMAVLRTSDEKLMAEFMKIGKIVWTDGQQAIADAKGWIFYGGASAVVVAVFAIYVFIRTILAPIREINLQLREIAEGDADLTRRLNVKNNDEIGDLAIGYNKMTEKLRDLISQISVSADMVSVSSEELNTSAESTKLATEQISSTIREISAGADHQVESVGSCAGEMERMSSGAQEIARNAGSVSDMAQQTSQIAREGNEAIRSAINQMTSIHTTIGGLSGVVQKLGERSEQIGNILGAITKISAQTNLLALNAAIEAARAGEQGRGFAVVADEVRKLAEQSSMSALEIGELIRAIQDETLQAMQSMDRGNEEVTVGISVVNKAGESFEQILEAVNQVAERIRVVSSASDQMSVGTSQVVHQFETISQVATGTAVGTQNVSAVAQEQLSSMNEIAMSASSLSMLAEELSMLVGKFKF